MDILAYRELHYSAPVATPAPPGVPQATRGRAAGVSAREVQALAKGAGATTAAASWWME